MRERWSWFLASGWLIVDWADHIRVENIWPVDDATLRHSHRSALRHSGIDPRITHLKGPGVGQWLPSWRHNATVGVSPSNNSAAGHRRRGPGLSAWNYHLLGGDLITGVVRLLGWDDGTRALEMLHQVIVNGLGNPDQSMASLGLGSSRLLAHDLHWAKATTGELKLSTRAFGVFLN